MSTQDEDPYIHHTYKLIEEDHLKAAEHNERAAQLHRDAAEALTKGELEKAAHHAHLAHGHHAHATHHMTEAAKKQAELSSNGKP